MGLGPLDLLVCPISSAPEVGMSWVGKVGRLMVECRGSPSAPHIRTLCMSSDGVGGGNGCTW